MEEDLEKRQPVSSPPSEQASVTGVMPPSLHFPYPAFSSLWEDEQVLGMTRAAEIFSPRPSGSQREIASEAEDSEFTTEDVQTTSALPEVQPEVSTTRTETGAQWVDDPRHDYPLVSIIPVPGPSSTDATELRPPQSQSLPPTTTGNNNLPSPNVLADDVPTNRVQLADRRRNRRRLPHPPPPPPPKAYTVTPTLPWLGASAEHLSLLSAIAAPPLEEAIDDGDDDEGFLPRIADLLRMSDIDPDRLCEEDRRLLFVLDHAVQTGGAERCGLDAGADEESGALRFVDLGRGGGGGGGGEGSQEGGEGGRGRGGRPEFVDVSLSQFLYFLAEALNERGSSAQLELGEEDGAEDYGGGGEASGSAAAEEVEEEEEEEEGEEEEGEEEEGEAEPIPFPHRPLMPSGHPPAAERVPAEASGSASQTALQDESHPQPATSHCELLLQKLEEYNLSLSDVSEAQIEDWKSVPIDAIEGYFETHLLDVLRWKKMKRASKKTKEDVVRERAKLTMLNEEKAPREYRTQMLGQMMATKESEDEGASQSFAPAKSNVELATLNHAGNVETKAKTEAQQVNAQSSKIKTGTYVKLAVGFILISGLIFGLVFGLRSHS